MTHWLVDALGTAVAVVILTGILTLAGIGAAPFLIWGLVKEKAWSLNHF